MHYFTDRVGAVHGVNVEIIHTVLHEVVALFDGKIHAGLKHFLGMSVTASRLSDYVDRGISLIYYHQSQGEDIRFRLLGGRNRDQSRAPVNVAHLFSKETPA